MSRHGTYQPGSPGQAADIKAAHRLPNGHRLCGLSADRAYDAGHLTRPLREAGIAAVIRLATALASPH